MASGVRIASSPGSGAACGSRAIDPSLSLSPHFDLILEPGEVAAERDKGATAQRRSEAVQVAPVTLLDRSELLSREEACRAIGFDHARPTVLLQLGSGENREVVGLIDQIIAQLELHPDVQIAIAEWANASGSLRLEERQGAEGGSAQPLFQCL